MKINVLVFPCGSEIGLEIYRSMSLSTHFELFGGSSVDDHGKFIFKNYISNLPYVNDEDFIAKINEVIKKNNIEYIFAAHDDVLLELSKAQLEGKLACQLVGSSAKTCEITRSKLKTYNHLKDVLLTPKVYEKAEDVKNSDLPVFLKPDVGQGAKGTFKATSIEDINFYKQKDPSLLILEYLPGKEFTVDCFTDKEGKLLFCEGRGRNRILNGISVNSSTIENKEILELAEIINSNLSLRGVWFFQVKESASGELSLMEIGARVAGTMGLVRCKGVNLPLLSLFDAMGVKVDILENNYDITIDRALENSYEIDINYQHVYLDLDDLVIFEGQVNPRVMALVFQCHNKGIKVHLITRHKQDLDQTLKNHKLSGIFDTVTWVKEGDEKYNYINETSSIYVDDSYAERKEIAEKCGIPVFDSHMIESLMEKF